MQSSKEKTEPTSASGLGKWAEDGTGACTGERPDGCLRARAPNAASARPSGGSSPWRPWRQCASPWQAARRRPRVTRPAAGMRPAAEATRRHRVHLVDGRGLRHVPCRPAGVHGGRGAFGLHARAAGAGHVHDLPCGRGDAVWRARGRHGRLHQAQEAEEERRDAGHLPGCRLPRRKPGRARGAHSRRDGADRLERDDGQPARGLGPDGGHADIVCADCHAMHSAGSTAAETCVSCHHAGVYECNTCH